MRLYLVRHGKADHGPVDAERPLSARGRSDIEAMAQHLHAEDIRVGRVVHSGLKRAFETAGILAGAVAPDLDIEPMTGIEPWGNVQAFAQTVDDWNDDTVVCGHEPFMGEAASLLMCGDAQAGLLTVKTGTIIALERMAYTSRWHLRWMLTPRIVRGAKEKDTV